MAETLVTVRFLTEDILVTRAGQRSRRTVVIPPSAVAIVGVGVSEMATNDVYQLNLRYYGVGTPGQNSAAFILGLTREYTDLVGDSFVVTAAPSQKIYYAQPSRLAIPVFVFGGTIGGFNNPSTVSLSDPQSGLTENYYLWESANAGLGTVEIQVRPS